eukprot:3005163-Rhodomonas_salina.2
MSSLDAESVHIAVAFSSASTFESICTAPVHIDEAEASVCGGRVNVTTSPRSNLMLYAKVSTNSTGSDALADEVQVKERPVSKNAPTDCEPETAVRGTGPATASNVTLVADRFAKMPSEGNRRFSFAEMTTYIDVLSANV